MKKLSMILLILALAFSSACVTEMTVHAESSDEFAFQILWTSDLHGAFSDWSYSTNSASTGLGRVATEINRLRGEQPNTILLDLGDTIQGNGTSVFHTAEWDNAEENIFGMYPVILGMEYLNYDAWVLGNHEFNFGVDRLEIALGDFSGAVLAGNVVDSNGDQVYDSVYVKDYTDIGGPRVAIIGMVHPNITSWDMGNMLAAGYDSVAADVRTKEIIDWLKSNDGIAAHGDIDLFIAAQHLAESDGYGSGDTASDVIAMNKDDLILFLGAHGHVQKAHLNDGVWYGEVRDAGRMLGQVEINARRSADGWHVTTDDIAITHIPVPNSAPVDRDYMEFVSKADSFAKAYTNTVIGRLEGGPLVPVPEILGTYEGYLQDTALVHIINDAMLYYANEYIQRTPELMERGMNVTLAGTAPLSTNANAQPGRLTRGDVSTIYMYDNNTLNIMELDGHQFKRWMEWSYLMIGEYTGDGYEGFNLGPVMEDGMLTIPYGNGNMPGYNMDHFKGVTYNVDLTKPYGERIVNLKCQTTGDDFDLDAIYWVAVNNYRSDSQLRLNAGETSRPAVFPEGYEPAAIIAENIDAVLTVDGKNPVNNGEGMLGVMVDWINRVNDGVITNEFEPTWSYITPEIDPELRAIAINLVNAGVLNQRPKQIGDSRGWEFSRRAILADEVSDVTDVLNIFSFNDFHGTVDKSASGSNPGADRFVAILETLTRDPNSVIFAAGDNYQGSPLSNLFYGEPVSTMMKHLGVEYSALGNHEFDWGQELIQKFSEDGDVTFLAANIIDINTGDVPSYVTPYTTIQLGSKRVGVIGLTTVNTPALVTEAAVHGLEFIEPGEWTSEMIDYLRTEMLCDIVIGLTHMGASRDDEDNVTGELVDLAYAVPEFDAIIGGHSHQWISEIINGVPIVQAGFNGRGIGRLTVVFEGDTFNIRNHVYVQNDINLNAILPNNPLVVNSNVTEIIKQYQDDIGPLFARVVGKYGEPIDSREAQAQWATDLVYDYITRVTGDEYILIQNNGGWRDTSPYDRKADDDVTVGYMYTLMPFDNEIVLLEMRGVDLLYMLELGVGDEPQLISAAIVSGAWKDDDGVWYTNAGDIILPDSTYRVACNDFMLTGGDRFPFPGTRWAVMADIEVLVEPSFMGVPLRDAMMDELQYRLIGEPIAAVY